MEYIDLDVYGMHDTSDKPVEYTNAQAVRNAFYLWLSSSTGDFLYNPAIGGIFDSLLFKRLKEEDDYTEMTFLIKNKVFSYFEPDVEFSSIVYRPNYSKNFLEIEVSFIDNLYKTTDSVSLFVNQKYSLEVNEYEDIPYTGVSLRDFVLVKKSGMMGDRLIFDMETEVWKWGKYKFTSLTTEDEMFDEILLITNGE